MDALPILLVCIFFLVGYSLAKCNLKKLDYEEEDEKGTVLAHYLDARNSHVEFFKNAFRGRLVDPICTAKQSVTNALCECINDKIVGQETGKAPKDNATENAVCGWRKLFKKKNISALKRINLFSCKIEDKIFYIMQGYEAHDDNFYDVYVVEKIEKSYFNFVIKGMARLVNFSELKAEDNTPMIAKLYRHGLSFLFGWN